MKNKLMIKCMNYKDSEVIRDYILRLKKDSIIKYKYMTIYNNDIEIVSNSDLDKIYSRVGIFICKSNIKVNMIVGKTIEGL